MRTLAFGSAMTFTPATTEGSESGLVPASAGPASATAPASFSSGPASPDALPASRTPASPASASPASTSASGAPASTMVLAGWGFFFGFGTATGSPPLAGSAGAAAAAGSGAGAGSSSITSIGMPVMGGASTSSTGGDQTLSKPARAAQGVSGTCSNTETTSSLAKRPVLVSAWPRR